MRKPFAVLLTILLLMLCACNTSSSTSQTDNSANNPLHGMWVCESDDIFYYYFLEDGVFCLVTSDNGDTIKAYDQYGIGSYTTNGNTVSITAFGESAEFTYNISGDKLSLNGDGENTVFQRCNVATHQSNVVGSWQIVGIDGDFSSFDPFLTSNEYVRTFTFYSDGSYAADMYYYFDLEEHFHEEYNGSYGLAHDGQTLSFDGQGYYDFRLLGYGLMLLTDQEGIDLLYILQ